MFMPESHQFPVAICKSRDYAIRKVRKDPLKVDELFGFGAITPEVARFAEATVHGALNVSVSGGTGSGKTTLLNVLSTVIPDTDRIVTIEDTAELQLQQRHVIPLEKRPVVYGGATMASPSIIILTNTS